MTLMVQIQSRGKKIFVKTIPPRVLHIRRQPPPPVTPAGCPFISVIIKFSSSYQKLSLLLLNHSVLRRLRRSEVREGTADGIYPICWVSRKRKEEMWTWSIFIINQIENTNFLKRKLGGGFNASFSQKKNLYLVPVHQNIVFLDVSQTKTYLILLHSQLRTSKSYSLSIRISILPNK